MADLEQIIIELDSLYCDYKNNKCLLNTGKSKEVAQYISDVTFAESVDYSFIAEQLSRFSADITSYYFHLVMTNKRVTPEMITEILNAFLAADNNDTRTRTFFMKYILAAREIIERLDVAAHVANLPDIILSAAKFAVQSEKNKEKFYWFINATKGKIFKLDYSHASKDLKMLWDAVNFIYPDISIVTYSEPITNWGKRYGFISTEASSADKCNSDDASSVIQSNDEHTGSDDEIKNDPDSSTINDSKEEAAEKEEKDYDNTAVLSAISKLIAPLCGAIQSIQGEVTKSREIGSLNESLTTKNKELEAQISELHEKLCNAERSVGTLTSEIGTLKDQLAALNAKNAELDLKLSEAYSINNRESSLEAEKVRSDLKKDFSYLYEDWLEYEFSDVSDENYESLQAIIKKIFRSLERHGIDFKGNGA